MPRPKRKQLVADLEQAVFEAGQWREQYNAAANDARELRYALGVERKAHTDTRLHAEAHKCDDKEGVIATLQSEAETLRIGLRELRLKKEAAEAEKVLTEGLVERHRESADAAAAEKVEPLKAVIASLVHIAEEFVKYDEYSSERVGAKGHIAFARSHLES